MTLCDLKPNEEATIVSVSDKQIAYQLFTKGIKPSKTISYKRKGMFGSVFYVIVDEMIVALRKREASNIILKKI